MVVRARGLALVVEIVCAVGFWEQIVMFVICVKSFFDFIR